MVETKNSYRHLDENVWPDRFVTSLLNTLKDPSKPDDEFQKLREKNRILMVTSVGNQTNPVDTTVDIEDRQGELVFIVPDPEQLLRMETLDALNLVKRSVDEFVKQLVRSETEGAVE